MSKIDDVAKKANVSKGTVSNVFSGKRPISEKVKNQVLEAAKELNYTPSHIARSLVTKKTMTISLNIPYSKNLPLSNFHINLINGVIMEASSHNYRILIDTLSRENLELQYMSREAVDGVILLDPRENDSRMKYLLDFNIPFVIIGQPSEEYIAQSIYVDNNNKELAKNITSFLINKGHRNILYLNAPLSMTVSTIRQNGFFKAFNDAQVNPNNSKVVFKDSLDIDPSLYGYNKVKEFFSKNRDGYTAIIADTDKVGLGASRALKELDLAVPEDVSLLALSDDLVLSHELAPPLSTVDLKGSELGSEAVRLLFAQLGIGNYKKIQTKIVEGKFNIRGSIHTAKE
ncbi:MULTISPECIES: LacI family DNA-binding transcriptional regulator [Gracilibacillus]|uniref:LacI family DNA-binding transcriptional regulator n=1 Tax=Gracilibacillus TaxID=74385 RepID=UPI000826C458|nr:MULTISPECIES: LacI family DNA-binding transcriptional regulator [Gracilibacillus]